MYILLIISFYLLFASFSSLVQAVLPSFDRANENVTVIIGSSALLPCFISNLGDHKVGDTCFFFSIDIYLSLKKHTDVWWLKFEQLR